MKLQQCLLATCGVVLLVVCLPGLVMGGGGPQDVLVVVNDNSPESLEVGKYYQEARGLHGFQVLHVQAETNYTTDYATFTNEVRDPVLNYIASSGLSNQIDYIVLSRDIPYRVRRVITPFPFGNTYTNDNGSTAVMFYDFKTYTDPALDSCTLPLSTFHDYFEAERSFARQASPGSNRYYLATVLNCWTVNQVKTIVDRSVLADHSDPTGTLFLIHSSSPLRAVRWTQFDDLDFSLSHLDVAQERDRYFGINLNNETNVVGAMIGRAGVPNVYDNDYEPGAIADHFTSYGGVLFEEFGGQMSIFDWLAAGCVGSYGTVVEPCNFTNKFPQARTHYWYGRGFNMAEAYWMSVQAPYMGVVVGDPLCQPYAVAPEVSLSGITEGAPVSGMFTVVVTGASADAARKVGQIDLLVDGRYLTTVTNLAPVSGTELTLVVNQTNCTYVVGAGETLFTVAEGLASSVNASNIGIKAVARGDRIALRQEALGVAGALSYAVSATNASGKRLLHPETVSTQLMESSCAAMQKLTIDGSLSSGDVLRVVVTRLDSVVITNSITATNNETARTFMGRFENAINADTNLSVATGCYAEDWQYAKRGPFSTLGEMYLFANSNGWNGYNLYVDYDVTGGGLDDTSYEGNFGSNSNDISARGTVFLHLGADTLTVTAVVDSATLADGPHKLIAVAYEGSAVKTQGRANRSFSVTNSTLSVSITNLGREVFMPVSSRATVMVAAVSSGSLVTGLRYNVEGKLEAVTNTSTASFLLHGTNYGAGLVRVESIAYNAAGGVAWSEPVLFRLYEDKDSDALPDWWEWARFGSESAYDGTNDPDGDGADNYHEFATDTEPLDGTNFFNAGTIEVDQSNDTVMVRFLSSTSRVYGVEYRLDLMATNELWLTDGTNSFYGDENVTRWIQSPVPTNDLRYYRVRGRLPGP